MRGSGRRGEIESKLSFHAAASMICFLLTREARTGLQEGRSYRWVVKSCNFSRPDGREELLLAEVSSFLLVVLSSPSTPTSPSSPSPFLRLFFPSHLLPSPSSNAFQCRTLLLPSSSKPRSQRIILALLAASTKLVLLRSLLPPRCSTTTHRKEFAS